MKKQFLLLLSVSFLAGCSLDFIPSPAKRKTIDASASIAEFFSGSYAVDSTAYNRFTKETYTIIDEVSSNAKTNKVLNENNYVISQTFIVSENGFAKEQYLDISNTVSTRDVSSTPVSFKDNYGSPLSKLVATSSDVETNFSCEGNVYSATEIGLVKAITPFASFFAFYGDTFSWDSKTVKETVENLKIEVDDSGVPSSMSFTKVKLDRYGGIKEDFQCSLREIDVVTSLSASQFGGNDEEKKALDEALDNLANKISSFNFTQTISHPYITGLIPYRNFYDFNEEGVGAMVCEIPFDASGYGLTYMGIAYSAYYEAYYMAGVSPDSNYYGAASQDYVESLSDIIPQIKKLGTDFFYFDGSEYIFDLDQFLYDDYLFSFSVLDVLFGTMDPCADKFGYYLSDDTYYAFDFHKVSIKINDETNLPTFTLVYTDSLDQEITVTSSFGDFGTTDLSKNKDLAKAYELLLEGNA